jgi:hypothetical protein
VKAGPREITVAFLKKSSAAVETARLPFLRPYAGAGGDTRTQPYLSTVTISGPYDASGPGDTPSRRRIFVCRPASPPEEAACADTILASLARRAYRRPVTAADLAMLRPFYDAGRTEGGFDTGIQRALERLLSCGAASPTRSCSTRPFEVSSVIPQSSKSRFGGCWPTPARGHW